MKLSIITINLNNAQGLFKTMDSVLKQTSNEFEYIIIDGGSSDNSLQIISDKCLKNHDNIEFSGDTELNGVRVRWISETDTGIYNAMNKGIRLANGDYLQFLNSGDILTTSDVIECILESLIDDCEILYGNMMKPLSKSLYRDRGFAGRIPTMLDFYIGTLNHSPTYIKRSLFETYGLYDESLKIVSDWKWFLQVIILNGIVPVYNDIDVTNFDMNGISNTSSNIDKAERKQILSELLPVSVLIDYERWAFPIEQMKRINRYWITRKGFWLVERILFKLEKIIDKLKSSKYERKN